MKRKIDRPLFSEKRMSAQESTIPKVATREFNRAFKHAIESGAVVTVAKDGRLLRVSKGSEQVVVRSLEGSYGSMKSGTRLNIKQNTPKA